METNKKPQNPSAFPGKVESLFGQETGNYHGMSLRDYYANSAMQGLISNHIIVEDISSSVPEWIAVRSYLIADAMLKQREL